MQIRLWWHSETRLLSSSSLVEQWALPPVYFLPSGTVGPSPAKLLPYMQIHP